MKIPVDIFSIDSFHSVLLVIIGLSILIVIYFYFSNFSSTKQPYHSQQYWESRYFVISKRMDWYFPFEEMRRKFNLDKLFVDIRCDKNNWKVLDLGCGNSSLPVDLYNYGFKKVFAIDFSQSVINEMKLTYSDYPVVFNCGDFNKLDEIYGKKQFNMILDKASIDAVVSKETDELSDEIYRLFTHFYHVLKNEGFYISLSIKNFDYWNNLVFQRLEKSRMFKMMKWEKNVFRVKPDSKDLLNIYFYVLKKLE